MARNNITFADLVAIARRVGVKVVEAPSSHRGKLGKMGTVVGVTCHHTGTPNSLRPTEEYLDFNVVKEGRPGLENSLSAFGLGRWSTIFVFSEFLSWHAGVWNWKGVTDGNGHFLGIEAAGIGDWTPFQREVYPRLVASILLFIGEGIDQAPRHADGAVPAGRKTDAANFAWFREKVAFFLAHPEHININYVEDDPVKNLTIVKEKQSGQLWVGDFIVRRKVANDELAGLQWQIEAHGGDKTVQTWDDVRVLGQDVAGDYTWIRDQIAGWLGGDRNSAPGASSPVLDAVKPPAA